MIWLQNKNLKTILKLFRMKIFHRHQIRAIVITLKIIAIIIAIVIKEIITKFNNKK